MKILQHAGLLKEQLLALGFPGGLEQELLFQLCFKPASFTARTVMNFGADSVLFTLEFERAEPSGDYRCLYFDATLRKQVVIGDAAGMLSNELASLMDSIPWNAIGDAESMQLEIATDIEKAIVALDKVSVTAEGKFLADTLRYKYWRDTVFEDRIAIAPGIRSRFEVRQHFYLFDGEARISVKDAYLFLNNKWMEKQLQAKKKSQVFAEEVTEPPAAASKRGRKKAA